MELVRATDDTFCIAVLGDFLGEGETPGGLDGVDLVPHRATPDSVMNLVGLRPRIRASLEADGGITQVEFTKLEDFDPGALFERLDVFAPLRGAREDAKAGRPHDFSPSGAPVPPEDPVTAGHTQPTAVDPTPNGAPALLDAILDVTQPSSEKPEAGSPEEIEAFVREVVRPHLVRDDTDEQARVAAMDEVVSRRVTELMHSPAFQELEAIWRSVVFMLSRIDTTGKVRVYLVQLPRSELARDLSDARGMETSRLYSLLSNPQLGSSGRRWGVAVGAYSFEPGAEEAGLLSRIASVSRAADVPWISALIPPSGGDLRGPGEALTPWFENLPSEWESLRNSPAAPWLGLTYPRFLLREPYGRGPRRAKGFAFREEAAAIEDLLWGLGPFLPAALMAQGVVAEGLRVRLGNHLDLGGLPLVAIPGQEDGTPTPVRVRLRPSEARSLMEVGLIPLIGLPEQAAVRVGGFFSIGGADVPLAGWWRT